MQVYKRVPADFKLGATLRWTSTPSRGGEVQILPVRLCAADTGGELRTDEPLGSYAAFPFT